MAQKYKNGDHAGKGAMFINGGKKEAKHPDWRGEAQIVCPHCGVETVYKKSAYTNHADTVGNYIKERYSIAIPIDENLNTGNHD